VFFDGCDEVIGVFLFCVSYSEVVNDEGKTDVTGLVDKKARGAFRWDVAAFGKSEFEVMQVYRSLQDT